MTIISGLASRLRSYLAQRFGLLNAAMSDMSQRVRNSIASHVANNFAGAIQELVENTITPPVPPRTRFLDSVPWHAREDSLASSHQANPRSELFGGNHDEPDTEEDFEQQPVQTATSRQHPRLRAALVTGLRAGTWCLCRRESGSFLAALFIGFSAGAMALFGGPVLAAGAATICSLLALTG